MLWIVVGLLAVIASTLLLGARITKIALLVSFVTLIGAAIGESINPLIGTGLGAMIGLLISGGIFALAQRGAKAS